MIFPQKNLPRPEGWKPVKKAALPASMGQRERKSIPFLNQK
jgi:hypothetical protein